MLRDLPVFGICGHSGSGKTTLIERLLPALSADGLAVAVAKGGAHHLDVDHEGKDSDRLFRAGADVYLEARDEALVRTRPADWPRHIPPGGSPHPPRTIPDESAARTGRAPRQRGGGRPGPARLADLARSYDLVLVEGRKDLACDKVWLLGPAEGAPPPVAGPFPAGPERVGSLRDRPLAVLGPGADRTAAVLEILRAWLPERWRRPPVFGCVLIGGRSRRMGRPKHLLRDGGTTWLERTVDALASAADRVVLVGGGALPETRSAPANVASGEGAARTGRDDPDGSAVVAENHRARPISDPLAALPRLPDVPDAQGPLAGILACMRWAPWATWLVTACDLPDLAPEALAWLLSRRRPGVWATLPRAAGGPYGSVPDGPPEPLLAHYDFRARAVLEALAAGGRLAPSAAAEHPKVATPRVPPHLARAWADVNTPTDLAGRRSQEG